MSNCLTKLVHDLFVSETYRLLVNLVESCLCLSDETKNLDPLPNCGIGEVPIVGGHVSGFFEMR